MGAILRPIRGRHLPSNSCVEELKHVGGREDEYALTGLATQYQLRGGGKDYQYDGRWDIEPKSAASFTTRLIVWRPARQDAFNGTVLVLWNNVSTGVDVCLAPARTRQLVADGFAVVGVSAQRVGVHGRGPVTLASLPGIVIPTPPPALREHDPERYGDLDHPGDGYSFDIFTQAGKALRETSGTIEPLGDLEAQHLVGVGVSQSANRLATYVNAIQKHSQRFDAFLLFVYAGVGCHLDATLVPDPPVSPYDIAHLLPWHSHLLREDLAIPILVVNSETEAGECHPNHNPDTEFMRWWEFAGTAHTGVSDPEELAAMRAVGGCTVSFEPAWRGAALAMARWLGGETPLPQSRLVPAGDPPAFERDDHGNAIGGVRLPELEAPLGTHVGQSPPGALLNMTGSSTPFPRKVVDQLYGTRDEWLARYRTALDHLVATGIFAPDDAVVILDRAELANFPD